jgi:hypothetical protein
MPIIQVKALEWKRRGQRPVYAGIAFSARRRSAPWTKAKLTTELMRFAIGHPGFDHSETRMALLPGGSLKRGAQGRDARARCDPSR